MVDSFINGEMEPIFHLTVSHARPMKLAKECVSSNVNVLNTKEGSVKYVAITKAWLLSTFIIVTRKRKILEYLLPE